MVNSTQLELVQGRQYEGAEVRCAPAAAVGKRVLFITDQLCAPGGSERTLFRMIEGLSGRGFDCRVVTFKHNSEIELFRRPPCPLTALPLRKTYDLNAIRVAMKIRQLIRAHAVDVVHTFHETSDLWGGAVAKLSSCPVLVSSRRDMGIFRSRKHGIAYRVANPWFDAVLTVSEQVRRYCIQTDGLAPEKVRTVYNGVDLGRIEQMPADNHLRRELGLSERAHVVTTVGNVRRVKGLDILLRAAASVCREAPETFFLVVGKTTEPDYLAELQQLAESMGLRDRVRFAGEREDVPAVLKASNIFCLPSRSEGFSNALIEAMACSLPCVATNVGGNAEAICDGANGFIVNPEQPEALAGRLLGLVREPATAREMGAAARRTVEKQFTFESMIDNLASIYAELAARKSRRPAAAASQKNQQTLRKCE